MTNFTRRQTLSIAGGVLASMASSANAQTTPIKIGFGMALTGGLAGGGKAALLAYQIWADEVNARGGLLGRKVELINYDDQSNPSTVPGIYSKLLDVDKVDLVVSGYATVPTAAAMPVIMQKGKTFLSLFALAINDQFNYDRYFQMQPTGPNSKIEFSRGFFRCPGRRRCRIQRDRARRCARKRQEGGNEGRFRSKLSAQHSGFRFDRSNHQGVQSGPALYRILSAGFGRHDPRDS
jgi:branched-chain amino acid transport system substrate-binding protein